MPLWLLIDFSPFSIINHLLPFPVNEKPHYCTVPACKKTAYKTRHAHVIQLGNAEEEMKKVMKRTN